MSIFSEQEPDQITDKLFLSGMSEAGNKEMLQRLGIKYILVAGNYLNMHFPDVNIF